MGRAGVKWKPGGSRRHQNGWAHGVSIHPSGTSHLRGWQVYSDKAGETFPSGKHRCKTAGLEGFAYRQNTLFQFPQHISRKQEKLRGTRSWIHWGPGNVTRSLLSETAPMHWRKTQWKNWEIHTITQHFRATCNNATRHEKGEEVCVRLFLLETGSQDRIWCCCR